MHIFYSPELVVGTLYYCHKKGNQSIIPLACFNCDVFTHKSGNARLFI